MSWDTGVLSLRLYRLNDSFGSHYRNIWIDNQIIRTMLKGLALTEIMKHRAHSHLISKNLRINVTRVYAC